MIWINQSGVHLTVSNRASLTCLISQPTKDVYKDARDLATHNSSKPKRPSVERINEPCHIHIGMEHETVLRTENLGNHKISYESNKILRKVKHLKKEYCMLPFTKSLKQTQ